MSDAETFLSLPSLLRQAMERSAGANGTEAITREKPVPYVVVTKEDWMLIREECIRMQEQLEGASNIIASLHIGVLTGNV